VPVTTGPIESNGGGSILNVLFVLSWLTLPIVGAYSSAKAARWSMTNRRVPFPGARGGLLAGARSG
jgi:hypothetical protein